MIRWGNSLQSWHSEKLDVQRRGVLFYYDKRESIVNCDCSSEKTR